MVKPDRWQLLLGIRDVVLGAFGSAAPLVKILKDFGRFSPPSNAKLLKIFKSFSTLLLICKLMLIFV